MNEQHPFTPQDLDELDHRLLAHADHVVSMQEVHAGNRDPRVIGMRHDCDAVHSLATAVHMAEWEAHRGHRSTYYVLHTSPYWHRPDFRLALEAIAVCGHEIGIHTDALAEALRTGRDPDAILAEALQTLRGWGFPVHGVAGHGNPICNRDRAQGELTFANDEHFIECARPQEGPPDRVITRGNIMLKLKPRPLADFGLDYEALRLGLPKPWRMSDSGGRWQHPNEPTFDHQADEFASRTITDRQFHLLVHPDWWAHAFHPQAAAA